MFLCLYKNAISHYSFSVYIDGTRGDIWSDLTKFWDPTVGILTKNSSEKSNAPHIPGVLPLGLNIDRCITCSVLPLTPNWLMGILEQNVTVCTTLTCKISQWNKFTTDRKITCGEFHAWKKIEKIFVSSAKYSIFWVKH